MYLEHFGLSAPPFQFTASPASLFMSRTHREGLAALEWGLLHEPSGLTLLIGDSGTGKTTLICALLARQHRAVHAAYLGNPKLSFPELLSSVMSQIGVRGGRSGKGAMLNAFQQYAAAMPLNERIAILVDEAQLLSEDAMEELRLLSNMECHGRKAAQIILAGQFELARRLASPAMRHFNERIGARAVLLALTPMECREYIEHRLRLCGSSSDRIFARGALDPLVRHSAGVPRRINALCHNSLLLAYSTESKRVSAAMVRQAAADYPVLEQSAAAAADEGSSAGRWRQLWRPLKPVLGLVLLGVAGFVSGEFLMSHGPVERRHGWLQRSSHTASAAAMPAVDVNRKAPSAPAPLSD